MKCGYAGGLSPDNIAEQLDLIDAAAGDVDYWVDAETHVRTEEVFDVEKCYRFLEVCEGKIKS